MRGMRFCADRERGRPARFGPVAVQRPALPRVLPSSRVLSRLAIRLFACVVAAVTVSAAASAAPGFQPHAFTEAHCAGCHNDVDRTGGLDLAGLTFAPGDANNLRQWIRIHDRVAAGEMPPAEKKRPEPGALEAFLRQLAGSVTAYEKEASAREGRAVRRRLNAYEYENVLRDLLSAPWLQIKGQFPEDGEAHRFNKVGSALDVSHVHMSRYMAAADYALRQVLSVEFVRPPATVTRHYARDQLTFLSKFTGSIFNSNPDRMMYPVIGLATPQPDVRWRRSPPTVGESNPELRDQEAVGWVSSNYVTGFTYRWDRFRAPVAGRYRIRFSGYTLWVAPGGVAMRFANEQDRVGTPRPPNPNVGDYDRLSPGRRHEPITVYTRNGVMNRRVGEFDLTPEPAVYDIGEIWLLANETLAPDASRFYRSRPNNFRNPLMTPEGAPSVAFRWMEVEGPLYDETTRAGYTLLFGELPLRKAAGGGGGVRVPVIAGRMPADTSRNAGQRVVPLEDVAVEVVSHEPLRDAERLIRGFLTRAYRRPVREADVRRFVGLVEERMQAGLSFTEAMVAGYTAVLASPGFVHLDEQPGPLDDYAIATRLALFLWNSEPDRGLRARADRGELRDPAVLRAETERMLGDPKARRFVDAFLDYWVDLRKMEDTTPSTTLYNDYYLDDALGEAAVLETQLFFEEMLRRDLPARTIIDSDFTFLNERLALHYDVPGVVGSRMRRVGLPPGSPRGGIMTQASVLKVTANGTTTSPVIRGNWILERILGEEVPPPPPVPAVEPDIRGAITIRQQLEKHRSDPSCASCHSKMDPPGFALESFDVMGGWRDRYRATAEDTPPVKGLGKNGQPFSFHFGLPVDAAGELPDGRTFADIREFKQLLRAEEVQLARNLAQQLIVYATGAPVRFSDRPEVEKILAASKPEDYGVRSMVHAIVQSDLFLRK
jgi:mono/diheme cytochrome c family protein